MMKNRISLLLTVLAVSLLFLASCGGTLSIDEIPAAELNDFQDYILTSYYLLKDSPAPASSSLDGDPGISRTTYPGHLYEIPYTFMFDAGFTKNGYPEVGQSTTFTATSEAAANVYKIVAVTTLSDWVTSWSSSLESVTETYYIKDVDVDGIYDDSDVITDISGTPDPLSRVTFEALFADGSKRYYEIQEALPNADPNGYQAFSIDGSLDFPDAGFTLTTDSSALWSSKVIYYQAINKNWIFWRKNQKVLVGARFYTEHGDPANPVKTSVAYERVVSGVEGISKESLASWVDYLIHGGTAPAGADTADLAETVIRYEIDAAGNKVIRQKTAVDNLEGDDFIFSAGIGTDAADPGESQISNQ